MTNNEPEKEIEQVVAEVKEATPQTTEEKKTTMSGLDENIAALLSYLISIISGIIFLVIEKENRFIRFHAMQSIFTFIFFLALNIALGFIPIIGWMISLFVGPVAFVLSIFLMVQAYKGNSFKLPYIGDLAEKHSVPK